MIRVVVVIMNDLMIVALIQRTDGKIKISLALCLQLGLLLDTNMYGWFHPAPTYRTGP
jgi:nanoRNase/pAp phosphatase (c-di-AMP/oligoRNAs hydrolase)